MQKVVRKEGKSVEHAVQLALEQLNVQRDQVEVEVIEYPNKGLFGLIGSKPAVVEVKIKESKGKLAKDFLHTVLEKMKVEAEIEVEETQSDIYINLKGKDMGVVIGYRGQTLDALQYIVSLYINKKTGSYKRIILDTENYRSKREKSLRKLAIKMAEKVRRTGKRVILEPMKPYERRILHATLQDNPYVYTHSEGEEPYRKVTICLK